MTTLEILLVENVKAHTQGAVAELVLSRPEEAGSEGDSLFADFVKRIVSNDMMSSRSMSRVKIAVKSAVLFGDVVGHMAQGGSRSGRFMEPMVVVVRDPVRYHVQIKFAEERFLFFRERLPPGEGKSPSS